MKPVENVLNWVVEFAGHVSVSCIKHTNDLFLDCAILMYDSKSSGSGEESNFNEQ